MTDSLLYADPPAAGERPFLCPESNMDKHSAVTELAVNGGVASFGAIANYLYAHLTQKVPLSWLRFTTNLMLGFFIGQVVGEFLPDDFAYRDGTLLVAGFSVYPLLQILELKGAELATKHLGFTSRPVTPKRKGGADT